MAPKKKQEKMSLGTFLQDETLGSWADEMEDMPLPEPQSRTSYGDRRAFSTNTGAGGASFGGDRRLEGYSVREQLPLPDKPPYTVHLANLSFDATQDDVNEFFQGCEVSSVRIVEDKMDRKPKGFGYVEFATLEGLKAALNLTGNNLAGRQVRISVADPPKNDRPEAREISDWSRKGPLPDIPNQRRVSDRPGYNRSFDNMSDAGSERGGRRAFGGESDGKVRDFSNWERRGPLSPSAVSTGPALSLREGGRQGSRNSPSWGEGRSNDGSRPPRREYEGRPAPERQPTAADMDNQWRSKMRPDAPVKIESPEASAPTSPAPSGPASRPRLNLQKRTVSEADPTGAAAAATDSKASPFGAARPVDTAAKEREVAEKREQERQEKREAEEKAKAEKAEEKRIAREKADAERKEAPSKEEEDATEDSPAKPKFDILRRTGSATNDMVADEDNEEIEENGQAEDKAVKPKEIVRDAPVNKTNGGAWRRGPKESAKPSEKPTEKPAEPSTTEAMEEDGWSTVSKPQKQRNNRRTNQPARAIAS